MTVIDKKIVGYAVKKDESEITEEAVPKILMNENISRPDVLIGSTYKIKSGNMEHAVYVTFNDMILNEGTEHEERHVYEMFINSKNMEYFQWVLALTRVVSAVFRKGGDVVFLVEELKQVFDPKDGGYFKKGGILVPSLVAEIGMALETHLIKIGMIKVEKPSEEKKKLIADKIEQLKKQEGEIVTEEDGYPKQARQCPKCLQRSVLRLDNCDTCINSDCSYSKCG